MNYHRLIFILAVATALGIGSAAADHRFRGRHFGGGFHSYHRHPGFGLYLGLPLFPRYYAPYPYYPYYPPSIVTVPVSPPVYIERTPPAVNQSMPSGYWYYCNNPPGYYPYVTDCPTGWRQVDPTPPR